MGLSGRLCNATPWLARVPYGTNLHLEIEGDAHRELTAGQLDDFRPGKPGSEEVRRMLDGYGCFLFDTDKSYDIQMLITIRACIKDRNVQFKEFVTSLRNQRVQAGMTSNSDEELEPAIEQAGYHLIRKQIETLTKREKRLALELEGETNRKRAPKYDPERTSFGMEPPREFATALALEMFHEEHDDVKERDADFRKQMDLAANAEA